MYTVLIGNSILEYMYVNYKSVKIVISVFKRGVGSYSWTTLYIYKV